MSQNVRQINVFLTFYVQWIKSLIRTRNTYLCYCLLIKFLIEMRGLKFDFGSKRCWDMRKALVICRDTDVFFIQLVAVLALTKEAAHLWGGAKEGVTDSVSFIPTILGTVVP